jgi:hypothetical protein
MPFPPRFLVIDFVREVPANNLVHKIIKMCEASGYTRGIFLRLLPVPYLSIKIFFFRSFNSEKWKICASKEKSSDPK